jgi:uncharacterized NAD(P)/FAD-binding protein YdhS
MDDNTLKKFCIIGMGFSGTCTFINFIKKLLNEKDIQNNCSITLIEQKRSNGHGYPYDKNDLLPAHLCNNPASSMSLWDNDFIDWMIENKTRLITECSHLVKQTHSDLNEIEFPDPNEFYPRALFGIYLNERFLEYLNIAKQNNIKVEVYNGYEAIDGYQSKGLYNLIIQDLMQNTTQELKGFSKILLSTGHWTAKDQGDSNPLFAKPYPFQNILTKVNILKDQKTKTNVLVRGMGPSGVDAILTLFSQGTFQYQNKVITNYKASDSDSTINIYAASRSGYFPAVRGNKPNYEFKYFTQNTFPELEQYLKRKLSLDDVIELLDLELKNATKGQISFDEISNLKFKNAYEKLKYDLNHQNINDLINTIILKVRRMKFYRHLNEIDKKRYDKELDHLFIRLAVPIPLENAQRLKLLFDSGLLKTIKLGYLNSNIQLSKNIVHINNSLENQVSFNLVINTISQNFDIKKHPSKLIQSLLNQKEIIPNIEGSYNTGGLMLDGYETYKVLQNHKGYIGASQFFYCIGVLTRYWQNERNFSQAIVEAADSVSNEWIELLINHNKQIFTPEQLYKIC